VRIQFFYSDEYERGCFIGYCEVQSYKVDRRFGGAYCLHHQGPDGGGSTYLLNVCRQLFYTAVHARKESELHARRRENLKSHINNVSDTY